MTPADPTSLLTLTAVSPRRFIRLEDGTTLGFEVGF